MDFLVLCLGEVEVSFLHPHGPAKSFRYLIVPDILTMNIEDILTAVNPTTVTGRAYTLTQEEGSAATSSLANRKNYKQR